MEITETKNKESNAVLNTNNLWYEIKVLVWPLLCFAFVLTSIYENIYFKTLGLNFSQVLYSNPDLLSSMLYFTFITFAAYKIYQLLEYMDLKSKLPKAIVSIIKYYPVLFILTYFLFPNSLFNLMIAIPPLVIFGIHWLLSAIYLDLKKVRSFTDVLNIPGFHILALVLSMTLSVSVNAYFNAKLIQNTNYTQTMIKFKNGEERVLLRMFDKGLITKSEKTGKIEYRRNLIDKIVEIYPEREGK